jgi:hypothetical protein
VGAAKPAKGSRRTKLSRKAQVEQAHKCLLGTWRSGKKRTMAGWLFKKGVSARHRTFIGSIFGKMTWRFTAKKSLHTKSEDRGANYSHSLLWADEWSVVLRIAGDGREKCYQLHFDGKHFYIPVTRNNSEYFRKLV